MWLKAYFFEKREMEDSNPTIAQSERNIWEISLF